MIYIGIDNGTSGAMVAIYPHKILCQPSFFIDIGGRKSLDVDRNLEWICALGSRENLSIAFEQAQINPLFSAKGNYAAGSGNEF